MITLRDYQIDGEMQIRHAFAVGFKAPLYVLPTGGGKCLGRGTPVLKFDGTVVPVEEIKTGDLLMGPDSSPRRVTSTCSGSEMMYRVTPVKGASFTVNESHILSVKMLPSNKLGYADHEVVNISIGDYFRESPTFRSCAKLWRTGVDFPPHQFEPPLPPYILGLWLGDGNSRHASITTADPEIESEWCQFISGIGMQYRRELMEGNKAVNIHVIVRPGSGGRVGGNRVMRALRKMNLLKNKHIPLRYLTGSHSERMELLAGIIDTDGALSRKGYDYISVRSELAKGVAYLARSLGFAAYVNECQKSSQNGTVGTYYRVSISGDLSGVPVRLARKKASPRAQIKSVLVTGMKIEAIGKDDYFGFELAGADRLFLLGDFTVTHNTVLFASIAHSAERRAKRVLILVHRVELVDQVVGALRDVDVYPDIIAASYARRAGGRNTTQRANHSVAVASVQTLIRRLDGYAAPDLIICDEAHHCVGGNGWSTIMSTYSTAKRLGTTATPIRLDGRGLAAHFDKLIVGPSVRELIDMGYLAPPRIFAPPTVDISGLHIRAGDYKNEESEALMDTPTITGDALDHYRRLADQKPALVFCTSVAHAHHVADRFRKDGIAAVALDGTTDREVRRVAVQEFRDGKIKVLASCDLFSEGFDCPGVHVGILLRPTASEALWRQQIGRVLRPAPGKQFALILDHVNSTRSFGLPDEPRQWVLTSDAIKRKKKDAPSVRVCVKCFAASPARSIVCRECGHVFEVKPRQDVTEKDGELVELTAEAIARKRERQAQGMAKGLKALQEIERRKGYKPGWALKVFQARKQKEKRA